MWYVYASIISSQVLWEAVSKDELQIVDVNYNINIWEGSVDCGTASIAFTLLLSESQYLITAWLHSSLLNSVSDREGYKCLDLL